MLKTAASKEVSLLHLGSQGVGGTFGDPVESVELTDESVCSCDSKSSCKLM